MNSQIVLKQIKYTQFIDIYLIFININIICEIK